MIIVSYLSSKEEIEQLFDLHVGEVFKISEGFEGVMSLIEQNVPEGEDFEVYPVNPGTDLFTMYGAGCCVVTQNSMI